MNKILSVFIFLVFTTFLFGQKEANIWYFGHNAGLDFNTSPPTPLLDGALYTDEGCASIADANGQILFYTDGSFVWNKNHNLMPNGSGLLGNKSSTQSGVIIPKPGSNHIYYVFTVDFTANSGGLAYSEVDMNLENGLGNVTATKNVQLITPACEKITAVLHENKQDIWVIGHDWESANFLAWLVTPSGVSSTPVISNVGSYIGGDEFNVIGYLKASAEGNKIAAAHWYGVKKVEVFDFDNVTGTLSNLISLSGFTGLGCYGVEFAPSEPILYVSEREAGGFLYQYDLSSGNPSTINASRITLASNDQRWGAIQLGPDKKMYVARKNNEYLGVINNPDLLGFACDYVHDGLYLGGQIGWIGLPSFIQSYFINIDFSYEGICAGSPTIFTLEVPDTNFDSLIWNFGDPLSLSNISSIYNPTHTYENAGTYEVTLIAYSQGLSDTSIQEITIESPNIDLGNDTSSCVGETITLDATTPNVTYLWSDNTTNATLDVNTSGTYWVEVEANGCLASDTIEVTFFDHPLLDLGADTSICENETYIFDGTTSDVVSYLWQNNTTAPTLTAAAAGQYSLLVTDTHGCTDTDTVSLTVHSFPVFEMAADTSICDGESLLLDINIGNTYSYLWQDGSSFPTFNVTEQGTYTAQVTANHCTTTHSMDVDILPVPDLDLEDNPTICEDETYIFDGTTLNVTDYLWQNGATTPTLLATNSGTYTLTVTSVNGCTTSDSEYLTIKPLPVFSLGADTEVCEGENYLLNVGMGNNTTYLWQDSTTNPTFNVSEPGTYSVQVTTDGCENEDEINIFYTSPPTVDLGNDTLICEGDELILDAYYDDMTTYAWQNNSDLPTFIVTDTGTYSVTLTNLCGSSFDKITIGQNQPPVPLFIGNDTILCLGDSYLLDATNTNTTHYLWQNGSNDSIMTIEDAGFYAVTWANACGFVTESFEVTTRKCDCPVIFPNVFSPNGDGWNEKFNTVSPCLFTKYNMKIFSRWGELLFETNDPAMDAGWDGTFKGKDVQVGVFIYVVEYAHEFDSGMVSGDVTITR